MPVILEFGLETLNSPEVGFGKMVMELAML
jgi:hypothetical protein